MTMEQCTAVTLLQSGNKSTDSECTYPKCEINCQRERAELGQSCKTRKYFHINCTKSPSVGSETN